MISSKLSVSWRTSCAALASTSRLVVIDFSTLWKGKSHARTPTRCDLVVAPCGLTTIWPSSSAQYSHGCAPTRTNWSVVMKWSGSHQ